MSSVTLNDSLSVTCKWAIARTFEGDWGAWEIPVYRKDLLWGINFYISAPTQGELEIKLAQHDKLVGRG